jgi:hypothetical protein
VLIDLLIGSGLSAIALALVGMFTVFGTRSFTAMGNYVNLDQYSRNALDVMTREIRQCTRLVGASTNYLVFEDFDGGTLRYEYVSSDKNLYRIKNGQTDAKPLLTGCDFLRFSIFQRNPILGTYDQYPTADPTTCKLVQLSWVCSRRILGNKNTESVQSAKVVIRKK